MFLKLVLFETSERPATFSNQISKAIGTSAALFRLNIVHFRCVLKCHPDVDYPVLYVIIN